MSTIFFFLSLSAGWSLQLLPGQFPVSLDVVVVLAIIAVVFVLFVTQPVPIDATAVGLVVALVLLGQWTGVSPEQGVSGFSNPATLTVLAMFVLSEGVRRTGVIQILTRKLVAFAGDNEFRQLLATVTLSGPPGGVVSNVSVVAVLIPAIMNLARQTKTSPSKLLIPLSFASMLGGMLTVVGTITNLLASEVWVQVGGPDAEPFALLEFTHLGAIVLLVGIVYLLTVGRYLTPARIEPAESPTDAFGMTDYLTDVVVMEDSPLVGSRVGELSERDLDLDVFQIVRGNRTLARGLGSERIRAGDVLSVRADQETLQEIIEQDHLQLLPEVMEAATEDDASLPPGFSPRRHGWEPSDAERSGSPAEDETSGEDTEEGGDETAEEAPDEAPHEGMTFAGATNFEAAYNTVHDSDKEGIDVKEVSAHGTVHHNHLYNLPRQGLYVDSWFGLLEDVEVYANRVHDCEWGVVISSEGEDSRMENVRVHHNLLYDNRASGVYFGTWGNDVQRSEIYIYNNTIHDNGTSGHWAGPTGGIDLRSKSLQDIYIFNNIASQNWAFEIATFAPPSDVPDSLSHKNITITHNLTGEFKSRTDEEGLYRTVYGYRGQEAVEGDPLFQNAGAGNFRLRNDSPAIGAGTTNWKPSTSSADLGAIPQNPSPADSTILPPGVVSP